MGTSWPADNPSVCVYVGPLKCDPVSSMRILMGSDSPAFYGMTPTHTLLHLGYKWWLRPLRHPRMYCSNWVMSALTPPLKTNEWCLRDCRQFLLSMVLTNVCYTHVILSACAFAELMPKFPTTVPNIPLVTWSFLMLWACLPLLYTASLFNTGVSHMKQETRLLK